MNTPTPAPQEAGVYSSSIGANRHHQVTIIDGVTVDERIVDNAGHTVYPAASRAATDAELPEVPCTWQKPGESDDAWIDRITGAAQPANPAPLTAAPSVPEEVLILIHKYGDARADDAGSAIAIGELVLGLRRWAAALASPQVAPALTDAQMDTALEAWFSEAYADGSSFRTRMRSAIAAIAAPVQVAPAEPENKSRVLYGDEPIDDQSFTPIKTVAPQDDARDAARYRKLRAHWFTMTAVYGDTINLAIRETRWHATLGESEIDAAIDALPEPTPAAKPTEEQGS